MNHRSQATVRVIQQVVADDPVELLVGMQGGDALVEALSVVGVVLLRLGFPVELGRAPAGFAAVADRGPAVPVEARAHLEIRLKLWSMRASMFRAFSTHVWSPAGLPATLLAMPARSGCTIRASDFRSHLTSQRIVGRDDVARIGIAYRDAVDQTGRGRIENLARENRPPERVGADLIARQQRAEIASLERVGGRRVAETRQHAGAQPRVVEVAEEERLVVPVVLRTA